MKQAQNAHRDYSWLPMVRDQLLDQLESWEGSESQSIEESHCRYQVARAAGALKEAMEQAEKL